jgi:hypothetical protein
MFEYTKPSGVAPAYGLTARNSAMTGSTDVRQKLQSGGSLLRNGAPRKRDGLVKGVTVQLVIDAGGAELVALSGQDGGAFGGEGHAGDGLPAEIEAHTRSDGIVQLSVGLVFGLRAHAGVGRLARVVFRLLAARS